MATYKEARGLPRDEQVESRRSATRASTRPPCPDCLAAHKSTVVHDALPKHERNHKKQLSVPTLPNPHQSVALKYRITLRICTKMIILVCASSNAPIRMANDMGQPAAQILGLR